MNVYFAITVLGDRSHVGEARKIVSVLESRGHEVITKHLFRDDAYELDGKISAQEMFERDIRWLRAADAVLIDATGSSFGIGFEAGFSLGALDKPVFLVYDQTKEEQVSRMARGLTHENATVFAYRDFGELVDFVGKNF